MFVDASALMAILLGEPEAAAFMARLSEARGKVLYSPVVRFEATVSLAMTRARAAGRTRTTADELAEAGHYVAEALRRMEAREVHLTASIGTAAVEAAGTYGKLVGHPADLNMGDCFSYACAKAYHASLLYKGNDFARTDLA